MNKIRTSMAIDEDSDMLVACRLVTPIGHSKGNYPCDAKLSELIMMFGQFYLSYHFPDQPIHHPVYKSVR